MGMIKSRVCAHCGCNIPDHRRKDAKYCSDQCGDKSRLKKHYSRHPEEYKEKRREYNRDVAKRMHSRIKSKAKKQSIPFDLDVEDIKIPDRCPVLGIKINSNVGKGSGFHPDSPSLDRIVPSLGYVKGNVRVISGRANLLKNDATSEELFLVYKDVERIEREQVSLRFGE